MATATLQPIIQAVEVWSADPGTETLRPSSGIADVDAGVAKYVVERTLRGLCPVVLNREDMAACWSSDSLASAVMTFPVVCKQQVRACVVLSICCPDDTMAAFEIWSRNERDELGLNGAVFASLSRFASISQYVKFPRGSGLPGQSWEDREVKLITGLGASPNFMRAAGARAGGLDVGLATPVMTTAHDLNSVILLLSARATPITRLFEVWDWDEEAGVATRRNAATSYCHAAMKAGESMSFAKGEGVVGRVVETGIPLASDELEQVAEKRCASLSSDQISCVVALPVFVGELLKSVVVLWN